MKNYIGVFLPERNETQQNKEKSVAARWQHLKRVLNQFLSSAGLERPRTKLPINWAKYNEVQSSYNENELEQRVSIIEKSELRENYVGDFMGMQVFEGDVEILDTREETKKLIPLKVRIIVARDMRLPYDTSSQYTEYSDVNNTFFASLYFQASSEALDQLVVVSTAESLKRSYPKGVQANEVLIRLLEQYQKINSAEYIYPLTIIYAHGLVDEDENHIVKSGISEGHPTHLVLDNLLHQYPVVAIEDKIPLLLTSCNETDKKSAWLHHPQIFIAYREGLAGGVFASGTTKLSE